MSLQQSPLNATHRSLGAKMVDFGGWDMPLHYGSQIDEHHAAMVTSAVVPAAEAHGLVELLEVERSAVVGAHGDQALPGVGRSSALVWAAAGGTVPIETTYFRAASTGMLRAMIRSSRQKRNIRYLQYLTNQVS